MWVAYGTVLAALLVYAASIALRGGNHYVPWLDETLVVVIEVSAGALCAVRAVTSGRSRAVPHSLATGLVLWTTGDLTWQLQSGGGAVPVPSVSDPLFLAFYPLVFVAAAAIVRERAPQAVLGTWLDGLLSALGTACLCAAAGFGSLLEFNGGSRAEVLVNLAYPLGDLVLLSLSVGATTLLPHRDRQGWLLLAGGSLFAWSDSAYLFQAAQDTYRQGTWVDLGWPAAIVVLSLAAWPIGSAPGSTRSGRYRRRAVLPVVAFVVGVAVLVTGAMHPMGLLAPALAAITLSVALARIVLLLWELKGLELEHGLRVQAESAHQELAEREAQNRALVVRLAGLLDAAPVGIIEVDLDGVVQRWNAAAERIYGWTEGEARGSAAPRAVPADGPAPASAHCVRAKAGVTPGTAAVPERHRRRDGSLVDVEVAEAELRDDAGRLTGWIRVVTDVSRRMELEVLLRHAQKMESIGRLSAGIAHEINTPIQFVGDNVRFLQRAFDDLAQLCEAQTAAIDIVDDPVGCRTAAARAREFADDIEVDFLREEAPLAARQAAEGIKRVTAIVRAMKAFGHPGEVHKALCDLNECIRNAVVVAHNELKNVATVELDLGEVPLVLSHPGDVQQVVLNLLVNAADAVTEAKLGAGVGMVRVTSREDGDEVVIEVSDNGVGIPADLKDKIFDPFFTTKPLGVGTGQGLALTRTLVVERHGGRIDFHSPRDGGTTFTVRFPVTP